ncbi:MAG: TonB-dependent receptor plug domain-containing protein [Sphingomonadales bacterium]|nr:TonB-dependent receptor plug domain-containing protein [Sphingomonadales bacterium]
MLVIALTIGCATPALAAADDSGEVAPPTQSNVQRSFSPEDLAQYSPKNALDMISNIPGFQIRGGDDARGLGQATENVLVNGQRLTSKSDSLTDQLARIPVNNIVRIEILNGTQLSIPGLVGQVANVVTRPDAFAGQFNWKGEARPHFSHPGYLNAEVSAKGTLGKIEYSVSLANDSGRGAFGGSYAIYNGDGSLREARNGRLWSDYDAPKATAGLKFSGPGDAVGNLNGSYRRVYSTYEESELRSPVGRTAYDRVLYGRQRDYNYEIGGDYEFGLLGGRLKLIGLDRFDHGTYSDREIRSPLDGSTPTGGRYSQTTDAGEVIGRAEYGWKWGKAEWQLAGEATFNRLDKVASLHELSPTGNFVELPFPGGSGGVREDRYEASLSFARPLAPKLRLQLILAAESSTIRQTGANALSRSFLRPKGTASLSWAPKKGLDVSFKVERNVGQLDFEDFLARVFLDQGNQNGNNAALVPSQDWNIELEAKKDLGPWGSTNLRIFGRFYEDYIDVIPLPGGGEGRGNVSGGKRYGLEWTSTFKLDRIGFKGAKIDSNVFLRKSSLTDPLTGEKRPMSGLTTRYINVEFRHDIPHSDWAWGAGIEHSERSHYYRVGEVGYDNEGPVFDFYYIEHKDVLGMTVRFNIINLADARHKLYRTVYAGPRDTAPVRFVEARSQLIGPIFRLTVKGNF